VREPLVKVVKDSLSSVLKKGDVILLAFSGGVDSSALLSLLVECRPFFLFDLHVAHFDHAWRKESALEVDILRSKVESLGVSFHSERSLGPSSNNKEEAARNERYQFLKKQYNLLGAKALLLAHQREDQAETVLKRVFEGAGVLSLGGMDAYSLYEEMKVVRPLLKVSRKDLLLWNEKKGVSYLTDYTNHDLHFLRPRMREKLFPEIENWFGKNVQKNLADLAEEFSFLKHFWKDRVQKLLLYKEEGAFGFFLPLMEMGLSVFERQELIREALKEKGICLGRPTLRKIEEILIQKLPDKQIDVERGELLLDKGNLFWFSQSIKDYDEGNGLDGWEVLEQECEHSIRYSFLQGVKTYRFLEDSNWSWSSYERLDVREKKRISLFFSKTKIPARLRRFFPFLVKNNKVIDLCFDLNNYEKEKILSIKLKKIYN
jgi:tRNA(Ile)-lysidine synthase